MICIQNRICKLNINGILNIYGFLDSRIENISYCNSEHVNGIEKFLEIGIRITRLIFL